MLVLEIQSYCCSPHRHDRLDVKLVKPIKHYNRFLLWDKQIALIEG